MAGFQLSGSATVPIAAVFSLAKHGRLMLRNMRRELITTGELMVQLRKQGIDDVAAVEPAFMENNGSISVIARDLPSHASPSRNRVI